MTDMTQHEIRNDGIGIFDESFSDDFCDRHIAYFSWLEATNATVGRDHLRHKLEDRSYNLISSPFHLRSFNLDYIAEEFLEAFWQNIYPKYARHYSILNEFSQHNIYDIKIQKTDVGQGYHEWHCENMNMHTRNRLMAFMLYLNDVDEGGETEFLYQKTRFKPKKNRLLLWPAGYTHTHRGNPPLSNEKYIITGWVECAV